MKIYTKDWTIKGTFKVEAASAEEAERKFGMLTEAELAEQGDLESEDAKEEQIE